jgi:hypothetical protein
MVTEEEQPNKTRLHRLTKALFSVQDSSASPAIFPQEAFSVLLANKVCEGSINQVQSDLLSRYLAASLAPEKTTGYMETVRPTV